MAGGLNNLAAESIKFAGIGYKLWHSDINFDASTPQKR